MSRKESVGSRGPVEGSPRSSRQRGSPAPEGSPHPEAETTAPASSHWQRIGADVNTGAEAIDPAELQEFLEADWSHIRADPKFKERLRGELWRMVEHLYGAKKNGDSSDD